MTFIIIKLNMMAFWRHGGAVAVAILLIKDNIHFSRRLTWNTYNTSLEVSLCLNVMESRR